MTDFDHDVAVIGGGPAGLAAAATAAEHGLDTVLLDEQAALGGQIYRNIEAVGAGDGERLELLGADYAHGSSLVRAFRASGAEHLPGTSVWEIETDGTVGLLRDGRAALVRARRIVIAAGAMERPVAIPGWTKPGVMTAGAAQTMLKSADAVPDGPLVIAGSGPLIYLVAWQLAKAGASLSAVLDTTPRGNYLNAIKTMAGVLGSISQLRKGRRWIAETRQAGVKFISWVGHLEALGDDRLEAVGYTAGGRRHRIDTGLLLLHQGVVPNGQLAMSIDCRQRWDELQACWHTETDEWGATSLDSVAVAGDCGGIGGAVVAEHRGRLAGLDAAYRLAKIEMGTRDRLAAGALSSIRKEAGLRRFLDTLYRPAEEFLAPPGNHVVVCRCEEVTAGELREVAAHGCMGPNQAKAFTRAGMGPCQGRMCGLAVAAIIGRARGMAPAEVGYTRVRPPLKPLTVGQLADLSGVGREVAALDAMPTKPGQGDSDGAQ
jgi:NADPH-dependent 2,4-dienoyl-CoA reductase/sulfur reductase-like enzyme